MSKKKNNSSTADEGNGGWAPGTSTDSFPRVWTTNTDGTTEIDMGSMGGYFPPYVTTTAPITGITYPPDYSNIISELEKEVKELKFKLMLSKGVTACLEEDVKSIKEQVNKIVELLEKKN